MSINSGTVSPNCCIQRVLEALGFPNKNYRWHLTAWRSNMGPLPLFLCLCYLPLWIQIHQTAGLRLRLPNVQSVPALCELVSPRSVWTDLSPLCVNWSLPALCELVSPRSVWTGLSPLCVNWSLPALCELVSPRSVWTGLSPLCVNWSLPALCELVSPRFVSHPLSTQTCPFIIPLANTCLSHGSITARYTADAHFPIY